jgi:ketosteroid isomerase-like protein
MSEQHRELIRSLYAALDRADGNAMVACYTPDARFSDPAFGALWGDEVGAMWRMLTSRATDLDVDLVEHDADGDTGSAHWIARYTVRPDWPPRHQRRPRQLPVRGREDRGAHRPVRLPRLVSPGARDPRAAARLDAPAPSAVRRRARRDLVRFMGGD